MTDIPPKPPRFPPGYLRGWALPLAANTVGAYVNVVLAHGNAQANNDALLLLNCAGVSASLAAQFLLVRRMRSDLKDWAALRREWDRLFSDKG